MCIRVQLTQFLSENQPDGDPRSKIFDTMHFEQPYSMQLVDTVATDHTITDCVAELDMLLGDRVRSDCLSSSRFET